MRKGKSLERLVAHLEKVLADKEYVSVEASKRLPDRTTGRLREHDVVLTVKQAHYEMLVAIECRGLSRPITVNQVEGFWAKCQDTGVAQGVIVSSKGFYSTARKKAEHLGIRCLDLEEATSFNWLLAPGFTIFQRRIKHTDWTLILKEDPRDKPTDFTLVAENGEEVQKQILLANAKKKLDELGLDPGKVGTFRETISFRGDGLFVRDNSTNECIPLRGIVAVVEYDVTIELAPFELLKYSEKAKKVDIADAAITTIKAGEISGKIMLVYRESEGGHLVFFPDKK